MHPRPSAPAVKPDSAAHSAVRAGFLRPGTCLVTPPRHPGFQGNGPSRPALAFSRLRSLGAGQIPAKPLRAAPLLPALLAARSGLGRSQQRVSISRGFWPRRLWLSFQQLRKVCLDSNGRCSSASKVGALDSEASPRRTQTCAGLSRRGGRHRSSPFSSSPLCGRCPRLAAPVSSIAPWAGARVHSPSPEAPLPWPRGGCHSQAAGWGPRPGVEGPVRPQAALLGVRTAVSSRVPRVVLRVPGSWPPSGKDASWMEASPVPLPPQSPRPKDGRSRVCSGVRTFRYGSRGDATQPTTAAAV